jgi:3-oxoacyl-[acyl-carrier protein] reductase
MSGPEADADRVAIVTGSSRGIGRYLAEHLLDRGYCVVGCSRGQCPWSAAGYTHMMCDVTVDDDVNQLIRRTVEEVAVPWAVINNAGAASMNHALLTPDSTVERMISANAVSTFRVSREAAKVMRKRGGGRIVNLSSIAVPLTLSGHAAYVTAKGAVEHLSRALARELAPFGITVNVVGPTPIDTRMTQGVDLEKLVGSLPIRRMGTMQEVALVVDLFLAREASGITAQLIYLGGVTDEVAPG